MRAAGIALAILIAVLLGAAAALFIADEDMPAWVVRRVRPVRLLLPAGDGRLRLPPDPFPTTQPAMSDTPPPARTAAHRPAATAIDAGQARDAVNHAAHAVFVAALLWYALHGEEEPGDQSLLRKSARRLARSLWWARPRLSALEAATRRRQGAGRVDREEGRARSSTGSLRMTPAPTTTPCSSGFGATIRRPPTPPLKVGVPARPCVVEGRRPLRCDPPHGGDGARHATRRGGVHRGAAPPDVDLTGRPEGTEAAPSTAWPCPPTRHPVPHLARRRHPELPR